MKRILTKMNLKYCSYEEETMVYCFWLMTSNIVYDILSFVNLARVKV
jgi:hypothetical protein